MAPSNVVVVGSIVFWSPAAPDLSHRVTVCFSGTTECVTRTDYIGCCFANFTGMVEGDDYNITVCSSSVVNGVACMSEACASITTGEINLFIPCIICFNISLFSFVPFIWL